MAAPGAAHASPENTVPSGPESVYIHGCTARRDGRAQSTAGVSGAHAQPKCRPSRQTSSSYHATSSTTTATTFPSVATHAAGTARFSKATPTTSSRAVMAFKLVTICFLRTNDKSHSTASAHPPPAPQEHTVPGHPGYLHRTLSWLGPNP